MKPRVVALSVSVMLALAGQVSAHEGHVHKMMGTVTAVDATHLEIDSKDGGKISIALNQDTKCLRGSAPAAVSDIKVGERVAVSAVEQEKKMVAREVRMAAADKHNP